jgi:hypothetical protein
MQRFDLVDQSLLTVMVSLSGQQVGYRKGHVRRGSLQSFGSSFGLWFWRDMNVLEGRKRALVLQLSMRYLRGWPCCSRFRDFNLVRNRTGYGE